MSRRAFLEAAGFTLASAATTGCSRPPTETRLAHVLQPGIASPGERLHYATTCAGCSAGCGVLASVRDARPVKLEGLPGHPISSGGLCAAGQASILGLYDSRRVREPLVDGRAVTWGSLDARLVQGLAAANGVVRVLTGTDAAASPTTKAMIARFLGGFENGRHDVYDVVPTSAIADAHRATHGQRALPRVRLDRADVILAIEADFLGTWISPVEFAAAYARSRPRWHVQVESCMTLTGAKADERYLAAPDEVGQVLLVLANGLARRGGRQVDVAAELPSTISRAAVEAWTEMLWSARGRSVVLCGSDDTRVQRIVNWCNELLGSYDSTLDLACPSMQRVGDDASVRRLGQELERGEVGVLVTCGVNPVHALPQGTQWREWLKKVPVLVAVTERIDETAALARYVCPAPHYLETWGDAEPAAGAVCLRQPTTEPMGDTRSFDASLAAWSGAPLDAESIVKRHWREHIFATERDGPSFQLFWDRSLQRGWVQRSVVVRSTPRVDAATVRPGAVPKPDAESLLLVGYPTVGLQDGRQGYNPWLLELPDPVTQVTWDNCASLAPATARSLGVCDGDIVRVTAEGADASIEIPVVVQPGQHERVVAVPIGFGQAATERFADLGPRWIGRRSRHDGPQLVGVNVGPLLANRDGGQSAYTSVRLEMTGRRRELARTQDHGWLQSVDADDWGTEASGALIRSRTERGYGTTSPTDDQAGRSSRVDLWGDEQPRGPGRRWGMAIDLDACTGCSACVIACQVENNTPVVGRDEVRRHRNMHWLRIDRYYRRDTHRVAMAHQPMTCHHCGHAPCETVCPVLATTHSSDGLNEQTYSRCIGTRYCMNNCPFKVRRFNWFDYAHDEPMESLVLNPDITVRTRGVAEKCTFCVQRIQEARIVARLAGKEITDGEVKTACEQSCPASAITFGDLNDPGSRVYALARDGRAYTLLDGLNLDPAIRYLGIVRRVRPAREDEHGP